jgi:hypothetical protein
MFVWINGINNGAIRSGHTPRDNLSPLRQFSFQPVNPDLVSQQFFQVPGFGDLDCGVVVKALLTIFGDGSFIRGKLSRLLLDVGEDCGHGGGVAGGDVFNIRRLNISTDGDGAIVIGVVLLHNTIQISR